VSVLDFGLLILAGIGSGLTGSIAGLASLVSYPAMLAVGIPPLHANVTNTVALVANGVGSTTASRREVAGQRGRVVELMVWAGIGGAIGSGLLLVASASVFEALVPWLVAFGSLLLLIRDALRGWLARRSGPGPAQLGRLTRLRNLVPMMLIGVYTGYFGAAGGIMMLALISLQTVEPLAVSNAIKNFTGWAANFVAAVIFACIAPVDWPAALAVAIGALGGAYAGQGVVRVLPERPLRIIIALLGFGLAVSLHFGWISG
jgi:uncharacterized protein